MYDRSYEKEQLRIYKEGNLRLLFMFLKINNEIWLLIFLIFYDKKYVAF